jgi:hypothetical protein
MTVSGASGDQPSARLRLAAELAVGLARRLWMTLHYDATDEGFCWHQAQTPFEDGCYVLWELGVASTLVATGNSHQGMTRRQYVDVGKHPGEETFAMYKFFPAAETQAGVLAHGELPDPLFERLLEAYVDTACEHGPAGTQLCSDRELFRAAAEFEREIGALVACGYAERCGDMVRWTDKIAPVMHAATGLDDPTPQITLPPDVLARVNMLVHDHNPIAAIALVREATGAGIVECKAYVDELARNSHRMPLHRPRG